MLNIYGGISLTNLSASLYTVRRMSLYVEKRSKIVRTQYVSKASGKPNESTQRSFNQSTHSLNDHHRLF